MDVFLTGFPKKLLVAISIIVIIGMCLMPAEARSIEHKKRHHRIQENHIDTKETAMMRLPNHANHKTRHQNRHPENLTLLPKSISLERRVKSYQAELFKNATRKIVKKLKNTRRYFNQERVRLNKSAEYKTIHGLAVPSWVPTVNFVEIHEHNYKASKRVKTTISERKFSYLMPKLYKSLREYEEIFKILLNIELEVTDNPFDNYRVIRQKIMSDTLQRLYSTIAEVTESMAAVNIAVPPFERKLKKLDALLIKMDATQCLQNDYFAFRGYGNLLNNWFMEFTCTKSKTSRGCSMYEYNIRDKKHKRRTKDSKTIT